MSRITAGRAIEGAIDTMNELRQRAQIQRIIDAAVADAVASALRAALTPARGGERGAGAESGGGALTAGQAPVAMLAGQVGRAATENGRQSLVSTSALVTEDALSRVAAALGTDGALRQSLVTTSAMATDAAVGAALAELFPECRGDDAAALACRRERMHELTRVAAATVPAGVRDALGWPLLLFAASIGAAIAVLVTWLLTTRQRRPRHAPARVSRRASNFTPARRRTRA